MLSLKNCLFVSLIGANCFIFSVSFDPLKSEIRLCRGFNLDVITCYWNDSLVDHKKIPLDLYYTKGLRTDLDCRVLHASHCTKCQRDDSRDYNITYNWCQLSYKNDSIHHIPYTFILISSNSSLVSDSEPLHIEDLYSIYEPGLTQRIRVSNTTSTTAHIHWDPPNKKSHLYHLQYHTSNDIIHSLNTSQTTCILSDLLPYSHYHLSIKSSYNSFSFTPLWSGWKSFHFDTLEDVPSACPVVFEGGFKRLSANKFKVIWKKMSKEFKNGNITKTRVQTMNECDVVTASLFREIKKNGLKKDNHPVLVMNSVEEYDEELAEVVLEGDEGCGYTVFVDMATMRGFNNSLNLKPLYIPSKSKAPQGINVLTLNATVVADGDFSVEWEERQSCISYRLFYWQHSLNQSTNHSSLNLSTSSHHLHLPQTPNQIWKFAVSTQYLNDTMGSAMVEASCVYNLSKQFASDPLDLQHSSTACSTIVHWSPPDCSTHYPAYFSYYQVSFSPSEHPQDLKVVRLERWESNLTIDQLLCGQSYQLNLSAVTANQSVLLNQIHVTIPSSSSPSIWLVSVMLVLMVACCMGLVLFRWVRQSRKSIIVTTLPLQYTNNEIEEDE